MVQQIPIPTANESTPSIPSLKRDRYTAALSPESSPSFPTSHPLPPVIKNSNSIPNFMKPNNLPNPVSLDNDDDILPSYADIGNY